MVTTSTRASAKAGIAVVSVMLGAPRYMLADAVVSSISSFSRVLRATVNLNVQVTGIAIESIPFLPEAQRLCFYN